MPKTPFSVRSLIAASLLALPAFATVAASCSAEKLGEGQRLGSGGATAGGGGNGGAVGTGSGCVGPGCAVDCGDTPKPGCACEVEGQHLLCGKAEATLSNGENEQTVCGKGVSTCTNGVWGACQINNSVTLIPDAPDGFYAKTLGGPSTCASNPCDPTCQDFVDTPSGLADAGTGITVGDAGLTLPGDGGAQCVKKTCADLGYNCGPASDGCGNLLQCGTCTSPATCGGGGVPSKCGTPVNCTNLCLQQVTCNPSTVKTTLTGRVYAPNGVDPLPGAVVYVPNSAVSAFPPNITCDTCGASTSGSPLVTVTTDVTGAFTLQNVPAGSNIPLVIQIGRWRRQVTVPSVPACTTTVVSAGLTRLPRTKAEGDIPRMAFVTGEVDALECVMRKIGVADSEFTNPNGGGRINLFAGGYYPGAYIGGYGYSGNQTEWEPDLLGSPSYLSQYDMVLFPCQGIPYYYNGGVQKTYETNLANYANAGGRIFTTHYNYGWIYSDGGNYSSPLSVAANWNVNGGVSPDPQTGYINTGFTKGATLAQWLQNAGASTTLGRITIDTLRTDFSSVNPAYSTNWMTLANGTQMHFTFNTPIGAAAANQCGRVVYSDFHVENAGDTQTSFPYECGNQAMTPQEKLLEYMLFDLASCVQPDSTVPTCTPITCAAQGLNCGQTGDGCGNTINCGTCTGGQTCGGGGPSGVCGTPLTYADGYFVRDYNAAAICGQGNAPFWRLWSWSALTPSDTHVDFKIRIADTAAGLNTATDYQVIFSNPPNAASLTTSTNWTGLPVGSAVAHAAGQPTSGQPDTQLGSTSIDATLKFYNLNPNPKYVRITSHLAPSSNKTVAPTLSSWDMQMDCQPSE